MPKKKIEFVKQNFVFFLFPYSLSITVDPATHEIKNYTHNLGDLRKLGRSPGE